MKLLVLGANGRTGRQIVHKALDEGHRVTGVVRSPEKGAALDHPAWRLHVADPCQASALRAVVPGHDAVVSVLGPKWPTTRSASVYVDAARALVEAMADGDVRRLIVASSGLLFPSQSLMVKALQWGVSPIVEAAGAMEAQIRGADLDWTIVRTSFLTDDTRPALVLGASAVDPTRMATAISRDALARFIIDEATDAQHQREIIALFGHGSAASSALANALNAAT